RSVSCTMKTTGPPERSHPVRERCAEWLILGIIRKSPRRRSPQLAGWAGEWPFVPTLADDWHLDDVAELLASQTEVPLSGWRGPAQAFLERLDGDAEVTAQWNQAAPTRIPG